MLISTTSIRTIRLSFPKYQNRWIHHHHHHHHRRIIIPNVITNNNIQIQQQQQQIRQLSSSSSTKNHHMALILGKPGGGKGTISGKILADFPQFQHLSSGDILRHHVREQTPIGQEAKSYMDKGALVPDDVMIQLIVTDAKAALGDDDGSSLLLDGFPRTREQAESLEEVLHVDFVINLNIPTETIVERLSDRWIHAPSGRVYSYSYKPPKVEGKDDVTGEALVQRDDDKPESIRKRLDLYDEATAPLIDFYGEKGVLKTFSGTMSDVIYPNVKEWLDEIMTTTK